MRRFLQALRIIPCATHRPHFIEPHLPRPRPGPARNLPVDPRHAWMRRSRGKKKPRSAGLSS
ncbi:hypothetical protein C9412_20200 [Stenotrophomonas sp. Nf1]|nr:hypothetical protein C9412_20200 [Stenotrophomonas sp. Nf1]PTA79642.1 hypothetical protein C9416_11150 [Stenotrophomonas sp. Nf4]